MSFPIIVVTFISEYLDSGLGMGYGTALTPVLILMGYHPLQVIPAVLISQLMTDITTCFFHHEMKNVDFNTQSNDFKVALRLGSISSLGVVSAVLIALKIPKWILMLYIGVLVTAMGILILVTLKRTLQFSWKKITITSFIAAFNKGISGGGYGPLVMGGQVLSGVNVKNAVGITAFSEAVTCLVGFGVYLLAGRVIDWKLTGMLVLAAVPAVPVAAYTVKKINTYKLKKYIGIMITLLGLLTLFRLSSG